MLEVEKDLRFWDVFFYNVNDELALFYTLLGFDSLKLNVLDVAVVYVGFIEMGRYAALGGEKVDVTVAFVGGDEQEGFTEP